MGFPGHSPQGPRPASLLCPLLALLTAVLGVSLHSAATCADRSAGLPAASSCVLSEVRCVQNEVRSVTFPGPCLVSWVRQQHGLAPGSQIQSPYSSPIRRTLYSLQLAQGDGCSLMRPQSSLIVKAPVTPAALTPCLSLLGFRSSPPWGMRWLRCPLQAKHTWGQSPPRRRVKVSPWGKLAWHWGKRMASAGSGFCGE